MRKIKTALKTEQLRLCNVLHYTEEGWTFRPLSAHFGRTLFQLPKLLRKLSKTIRKFPDAAAYVYDKIPVAANGEEWMVCFRCGSLAIKSELGDYPYQCFECCEDLYSIEVEKAEGTHNIAELIALVAETMEGEK